MVEESGFRGVVEFLGRIGVYDIVLPFLLVFTIVFAILEKTKILGVDVIEGKQYPKKNLNAMVAFVAAFLIIASTKLISVINEVLSHVVLLLILAVCFLLLVGVFFTDREFSLEQYPGWIVFFMVIMFIAIVIIFLHALDWLHYIVDLVEAWDAEWAVTIIFLIIILLFIWYIIHEPKAKKEERVTHKEKKE